MATKTDIAPDGDVTLVIGQEETTFKVYSQVLKSASRAFAAMLNPQFSEGRKLAKDGSTTIPLPEDDPEAMEILLTVLHHQHDGWLDHLKFDGSFILRVIIATDKYDCKMAMKLAAEAWCRRAIGILDIKTDELFDWLKAAYWFDLEQASKDLSFRLILEHRGSFVEFGKADTSDLDRDVLFRIIRSLENQQTKIKQALLEKTFSETQWMIGGCNCGWVEKNLRLWIRSLTRSSFLNDLWTPSINQLLDEARNLEEPGELYDENEECGNSRRHRYQLHQFNNLLDVKHDPRYRGVDLAHIRPFDKKE